MTAPDLLALLALDDAAFREKFRDSPIRRTKRRGLLRNVCVALGNLGDPRALPALKHAAEHDPEPLVREHARWAVEKIRTYPGAGAVGTYPGAGAVGTYPGASADPPETGR